MTTFKKFFLTAKHWQIFLLLFVIPLVVEFAAMVFVPAMITGSWQAMLFLIGAMLLYLSCYLGWLWSMGFFLGSILPSHLKMKDGFLGFALVYPLLYVPVFISITFAPGLDSAFAIIIPFHFFGMFCIFYALYFVSKAMVMAETGRVASFYDYAGPFFLNWFYPFGIWFIQPRINRLYTLRKNS